MVCVWEKMHFTNLVVWGDVIGGTLPCIVTCSDLEGQKILKRVIAALYCSSGTGSNCNSFPSGSKGLTAQGLKTRGMQVCSLGKTVLQFSKQNSEKIGPLLQC